MLSHALSRRANAGAVYFIAGVVDGDGAIKEGLVVDCLNESALRLGPKFELRA